ncbi:hypothetical protein P4S72_00885 [Vibrio sp. PP-XX7]
MTQGWQRADAAIQQVQAGYNVALVCSGDAGMYAMAPLILSYSPRSLFISKWKQFPGLRRRTLARHWWAHL